MKWLWIVLPMVCVVLVVPCAAENNRDTKSTISISPGELTPTPDMWFYEQYQKQYLDSKTAVRQKAEFRAAERQRRISALRWYGFSNSRPTSGVDLVHGDQAPHWTANNVNLPHRWNGSTTTTVIVRPTNPPARGY